MSIEIHWIISPHGFGHLKRVAQVTCALNKISPVKIDHIWHVNDKYWQSHKQIVESDKCLVEHVHFSLFHDTMKHNTSWSDSNYSLSEYNLWRNDLKAFEFADRFVVSDNLITPLEFTSNGILMGSFLWPLLHHQVQSESYSIIREKEIAILNNQRPTMLGQEVMVSEQVKEHTRFYGFPWFCENERLADSSANLSNILFTGGGTGKASKEVTDCLCNYAKEDGYRCFTDSRIWNILPESIKSKVSVFEFTKEDFMALQWIVARPGVGIISDSMMHGIPLIAVYEKEQDEMRHNATVLSKKSLCVIPINFSDVTALLNDQILNKKIRKNINQEAVQGHLKAAEFILQNIYETSKN